MKYLQIPDEHYATIIETLEMDSRAGNFDQSLRKEIQSALESIKKLNPKIIVRVEGGNVHGCYANMPMSVDVMDLDNASADEKAGVECKKLQAECKKLISVY